MSINKLGLIKGGAGAGADKEREGLPPEAWPDDDGGRVGEADERAGNLVPGERQSA